MWIRLAWDEIVHLKMLDTLSIENCQKSNANFLKCSKLMLATHNRLSPEWPVYPGQGAWRGRAVTRADRQPRPLSSCSAASWRSWPAPPHSWWRRRAWQRWGRSEMHILEIMKPDFIFTTLKHLTSVWRQISVKSDMQAKSKVKALQRCNKSVVLSCLTISTADV